ncbi:MAG: DUF4411 family protein [Candidatus ainarchaeum sp.]|nr:DUF4411 family protein [Candidatus ainarchaeum sp.]
MTNKKLIIDTCSIRDFFKFYLFKSDNQEIFQGLLNFFVKKVESGEIIIIDKVWEELPNWTRYKLSIKISKYIIDTKNLFNNVEQIIDDNKRNDILNKMDSNKQTIELDKYAFGPIADIYLLAYSANLKNQNVDNILVTEESKRDDGKILPKLPELCEKENIEYQNIPKILFNFYKDELNFSLNIA